MEILTIKPEDYQKLTSGERYAYHYQRDQEQLARAAAMPAEVWLDPGSMERGMFAEDQPTGDPMWTPCAQHGYAYDVKYIRADTLRGSTAERVKLSERIQKLEAELAAFPLLEESETVRGQLPPAYKPPVYNQ